MEAKNIVPALMVLAGTIIIVTAIFGLYKIMEIVVGISLIAFGLYFVISAVFLGIRRAKLRR